VQPHYLTLSSCASTPWQETNWQISPFEASFAVIANSTSTFNIDLAFEDPTGVFPNPNSSSPTAFSLISSGSSSQVVVPSSLSPFAAYRFTMNVTSSVGAKTTLCFMQAGIG